MALAADTRLLDCFSRWLGDTNHHNDRQGRGVWFGLAGRVLQTNSVPLDGLKNVAIAF
jgi:hypothetical protein